MPSQIKEASTWVRLFWAVRMTTIQFAWFASLVYFFFAPWVSVAIVAVLLAWTYWEVNNYCNWFEEKAGK